MRTSARLRIDAEPPSVDALHRIHRAHVDRIPYETTWIQLGEQWTIDTDAAVDAPPVKARRVLLPPHGASRRSAARASVCARCTSVACTDRSRASRT